MLQAHRRFLAAALAPLLSSLVVIGAYLAYGHLASGARSIAEVPASATQALAGGTTLGVVVLSLPLVLPLHRAGIRLRPTFTFPAGAARRVRSLAGAGLLALLAQQVEEAIREAGAAEVPAHQVGLAILAPLRDLDEVAYLRFASVYHSFESLTDFEAEITALRASARCATDPRDSPSTAVPDALVPAG